MERAPNALCTRGAKVVHGIELLHAHQMRFQQNAAGWYLNYAIITSLDVPIWRVNMKCSAKHVENKTRHDDDDVGAQVRDDTVNVSFSRPLWTSTWMMSFVGEMTDGQ